jgi:hypothetical protein
VDTNYIIELRFDARGVRGWLTRMLLRLLPLGRIATDGFFHVKIYQFGRATSSIVEGYVGTDGQLTVTMDAGGVTRFKTQSHGVKDA